MLDSLNDELAECQEAIRQKRKLERDCGAAKSQLAVELARLDELATKLAAEARDVEKLEGTSLTGLFYGVLGLKADKLEKEKQELLAARLEHDEALTAVKILKEQVADVEAKLDRIGDADARYAAALRSKEQAIVDSAHPAAAELVATAKQQGDCSADASETAEALAAAERVASGLAAVEQSLGSARSWGTWDMIGGGSISTWIKHSKIDDAKDGIARVQADIRTLQRELADVNIEADIKVEIGAFTRFADWFFDGLIFDWAVQSKIVRSLERVQQARRDIGGLVERLRRRRAELAARLAELRAQRTQLIEQASG